jgi:hypothetical protein
MARLDRAPFRRAARFATMKSSPDAASETLCHPRPRPIRPPPIADPRTSGRAQSYAEERAGTYFTSRGRDWNWDSPFALSLYYRYPRCLSRSEDVVEGPHLPLYEAPLRALASPFIGRLSATGTKCTSVGHYGFHCVIMPRFKIIQSYCNSPLLGTDHEPSIENSSEHFEVKIKAFLF